jgi:hypothetical protein
MRAEFHMFVRAVAHRDHVATCSHKVKKGDGIGYAPKTRETVCSDCWHAWTDGYAQEDERFGDIDDHG